MEPEKFIEQIKKTFSRAAMLPARMQQILLEDINCYRKPHPNDGTHHSSSGLFAQAENVNSQGTTITHCNLFVAVVRTLELGFLKLYLITPNNNSVNFALIIGEPYQFALHAFSSNYESLRFSFKSVCNMHNI